MNMGVGDWTAQDAVVTLLERAGQDFRTDPHLRETPKRFVEAWDFWTEGYHLDDVATVLKTFEFAGNDPGLVFQANIPVWSLCCHHLAPFWGLAHVGYLPKKGVVGLSKLARVVDIFARRLQVQEQLGSQIADALFTNLDCHGVGVVLQCRHACLESRGVQKAGTITITSSLRGFMKDEPETRSEFMSLIQVAIQGAKGV